MPSVLPMQGRFPGGSASIVKWARRQSRTVEEYDFYFFFFSFSACENQAGGVGNSVSNWSECLPAPSKAHLTSAIDRPRSHVCTHCLGDRRITTRNTFLEIWPCKLRSLSAFIIIIIIIIFFYRRSHNELGSNPLPPIWKFFRLSAMCEILRWPLKPIEILWYRSKGSLDTYCDKVCLFLLVQLFSSLRLKRSTILVHSGKRKCKIRNNILNIQKNFWKKAKKLWRSLRYDDLWKRQKGLWRWSRYDEHYANNKLQFAQALHDGMCSTHQMQMCNLPVCCMTIPGDELSEDGPHLSATCVSVPKATTKRPRETYEPDSTI